MKSIKEGNTFFAGHGAQVYDIYNLTWLKVLKISSYYYFI